MNTMLGSKRTIDSGIIVIKGRKVAAVGKNAFKGIQKKAKFTLPAAKAKEYKKKIKKAGFTLK